MTTECYHSKCKFHPNQTDPDDGPFCYEDDCRLSVEEADDFRKDYYEQAHYSRQSVAKKKISQ